MKPGEIAERWEKYQKRTNTPDAEYAATIFIYVLDLLDALEVVPSASADLEDDELIDEEDGAEFVERFIDRTHHLGIPALSPRKQSPHSPLLPPVELSSTVVPHDSHLGKP